MKYNTMRYVLIYFANFKISKQQFIGVNVHYAECYFIRIPK